MTDAKDKAVAVDGVIGDFRVVASRPGGPEVLAMDPLSLPPPEPAELRIRHKAIGVNFVDTYYRSGLYPLPMPASLGGEAAGVVEAIGGEVTGFAVGDRVAYGTGGQGSYATVRNLAAEHCFKLPSGIDDDMAAAVMLKGMTAAYLIGPCAQVERGQWVLVHAAAGGVGTILVQWLLASGARVIAHVGSQEKAARIVALGAEKVLSCGMDLLPAAVTDITNGRGASVVLDGVGAASWQASLKSVSTRGLVVSYGNASGPVPPFTALDLGAAGSVYVTRPSLRDYARTRTERAELVAALFAIIETGSVKVDIGQRFALEQACDAHEALESRHTRGSTILVPPPFPLRT